MSVEDEIHIIATATHPVHGRVIVFEESPEWVFMAPVISEPPFYGQDFRVTREQYKEFMPEPCVILEVECIQCGVMVDGGCVPDHQIPRKKAEREALRELRGCCGERKANKPKITWR